MKGKLELIENVGLVVPEKDSYHSNSRSFAKLDTQAPNNRRKSKIEIV